MNTRFATRSNQIVTSTTFSLKQYKLNFLIDFIVARKGNEKIFQQWRVQNMVQPLLITNHY